MLGYIEILAILLRSLQCLLTASAFGISIYMVWYLTPYASHYTNLWFAASVISTVYFISLGILSITRRQLTPLTLSGVEFLQFFMWTASFGLAVKSFAAIDCRTAGEELSLKPGINQVSFCYLGQAMIGLCAATMVLFFVSASSLWVTYRNIASDHGWLGWGALTFDPRPRQPEDGFSFVEKGAKEESYSSEVKKGADTDEMV